jgi:hypothetical protein
MPNKIERLCSVVTGLALTNSSSTSAIIPFKACAGGMIEVTAAAGGATTITWNALMEHGGTPRPIQKDGADLTTTIAVNKSYPIPDEAFSAPFLVAVLNAGTATVSLSVKG